jgi:membrane protein DedA with SNARE-associated domain
MDLLTLITQVASHAKYPVVFLLFLVDGTSTNFISSTLAATGVLNIWIIWVAAIVLEVCVDLFYYFLGGKLSEKQISSKVGKGEGNNFLNTLDNAYKKHPGITLMVVKFLGPFAIPGILYMGKLKALNIEKFVEYSLIVAITRGTFLSFLGYMVGRGLHKFMKIYDLLKVLGIVLIVVIVLFLLYKTYQKKIEEFFLSIFKKIK